VADSNPDRPPQDWIRGWSARRHGQDTLPHTIGRRRIYILPTRVGLMLAAVLVAMLVASLNYNSNLGLALAFLMIGVALVIMHHCNRNMLSLKIDAVTQGDAFAWQPATLVFGLRNDSAVDRRDIEIHCLGASAPAIVPARSSASLEVRVAAAARGVVHARQIELRTRYPFGWFHAWSYVHAPLTVFVAPAPRGERTLPWTEGEGSGSRTESRGDEDFAGLRAYEPGIPLKHMAWKALARGGEPAVRSYTGLSAQPEWLDFDALEGGDTETRLSQLCLWVLEGDASGRVYGLRTPGREVAPGRGPAHRTECLRALAGFEAGAS
jgi:uncharacterized protein (DUF58 family)